MNRRSFLKFLFLGATAMSVELLLPRRLRAQDDTIKSWFDAYADTVGINSARSLTQSNRAGRERRRVNNIMARSGYTYNHRGERYEDYTNVSDLAKYVAPFGSASDVETYVVVNENIFDICVPFYPNYAEGTRKAIMESPQVIGAAMASAAYKEVNPRASTSQLKDVFLPRGYIDNPETDDMLGAEETLGVYRTRNGELSVQSRRNGNNINLSVEASGEIDFNENFNFRLD